MNELSLFTGAGGGLLGTKLLGFRPIGYVEWEPYCQAVIAQRIKDGLLEEAPIFGDIRQFVKSGAAAQYRGFADVVSAGWPCGPHSLSGNRLGSEDEADMWGPTADTIRAVRPEFFLGENVPGMLTSQGGAYFSRVLGDLASMGYDAEWGVLSANAEGAPHLRERFFIVAHANQAPAQRDCSAIGIQKRFAFNSQHDWGQAVSPLDRIHDGVGEWVDRLKAIGNGQVPIVVARAWQVLSN